MCNQNNNNVRAAEAGEVQTCPAVGYQSASVCVPVTVTPSSPPAVRPATG